jgi:hypothetical protein
MACCGWLNRVRREFVFRHQQSFHPQALACQFFLKSQKWCFVKKRNLSSWFTVLRSITRTMTVEDGWITFDCLPLLILLNRGWWIKAFLYYFSWTVEIFLSCCYFILTVGWALWLVPELQNLWYLGFILTPIQCFEKASYCSHSRAYQALWLFYRTLKP